jgi:hypothetical protein
MASVQVAVTAHRGVRWATHSFNCRSTSLFGLNIENLNPTAALNNFMLRQCILVLFLKQCFWIHKQLYTSIFGLAVSLSFSIQLTEGFKFKKVEIWKLVDRVSGNNCGFLDYNTVYSAGEYRSFVRTYCHHLQDKSVFNLNMETLCPSKKAYQPVSLRGIKTKWTYYKPAP